MTGTKCMVLKTGTAKDTYKVVSMVNTTCRDKGEVITKDDVKTLVANDVEVIID